MISRWGFIPHRSLLLSALRGLSTSTPSRELSLYELLEVKKTAEPWEIKAAFRRKAKLLHPDAQSHTGRADREAFVHLLHAYQVLHNPRSRALYDLSISSKEHSILRKAAASGVHGGSGDEDLEIDLSWGLGWLFQSAPHALASEQSTTLDKLRIELQSDLHVALRHAYLGPKLDLEDAYHLPEAFEGDERSTPEAPDLLELVSGRQLLGVVRERRAAQLGVRWRQGPSLAGRAGQPRPAGGLIKAGEQEGEGTANQQQQCMGGAAQQHYVGGANPAAGSHPGAPASGCSTDLAAGREGPAASAAGPSSGSADSNSSSRSWEGECQLAAAEVGEEDQGPEVLELVMGEQVVAWAVRCSLRAGPQGASTHGGGVQSGGLGPHAAAGGSSSGGISESSMEFHGPGVGAATAGTDQQQRGSTCGEPCAGPPQRHEPLALVSFYRGEELLGMLQGEHRASTSNSPSAARFINPQGVHTHTVLRSSSPLVRHLSVVAEPTTGVARSKRSNATVFRARRAWLPPSGLWLFRPRNYEHDIGGWYFEWAGHGSRSHPAWLDPAVAVLAAGFDTLDHERAKQQPQGLFGRLRAGDETASGVGGWLKAMLRFHGVRK